MQNECNHESKQAIYIFAVELRYSVFIMLSFKAN